MRGYADNLDAGTDLAEAERAAAVAAHHARQQQRRAAAQQRAAARGLRADCEDCGDPIHPLRRVAVPHATRCAHCQGIAERGRVV